MVWLTQVAQMRWNPITISSFFPNRNASEGSIACESHYSGSASCWRNLGSRNTRWGTTKICPADLLTWPYSGRRCLLSQQWLISPLVLAKKCSWCFIFSFHGCSAPGHSRATPCFTPYKKLLQNLLAVLLSSVWVVFLLQWRIKLICLHSFSSGVAQSRNTHCCAPQGWGRPKVQLKFS